MPWTINFEDAALKEFGKLDPPLQKTLLRYLKEKISLADDPRQYGEPLRSNLAGLWKYRVGNYRIICSINPADITILVLRIGHRRKVYGDH